MNYGARAPDIFHVPDILVYEQGPVPCIHSANTNRLVCTSTATPTKSSGIAQAGNGYLQIAKGLPKMLFSTKAEVFDTQTFNELQRFSEPYYSTSQPLAKPLPFNLT